MTRRGLFGLLAGILSKIGLAKEESLKVSEIAHGTWITANCTTDTEVWISVDSGPERLAGIMSPPDRFFYVPLNSQPKSIKVRMEPLKKSSFKIYKFTVTNRDRS